MDDSSSKPRGGKPDASSPTRTLAKSCQERLRNRWQNPRTLLCVGLDPEYDRLPSAVRSAQTGLLALDEERHGSHVEGALIAFNQAIVDATADLVCAFKPNAAFYEAYGVAGMRALTRTIAYIHARYPEIPVILDAKRGDIGSTSEAYARAAFDAMGADALTVQPYLGREAVAPILDRANNMSFILCRTSNPGSGEFQELSVRPNTEGAVEQPFYLHVAEQVVNEWNTHGNCGLVVGATYPDDLRQVRARVGDLPILVPGVGAQGGDLEDTLHAGLDAQGAGLVISVTRSVLYASNGLDFASAARREALRLWRIIDDVRTGNA